MRSEKRAGTAPLKILVTGASGFVGAALVALLSRGESNSIVAAVRSLNSQARRNNRNVRYCSIPNIDSTTDWSMALDDVDVVVHTAARAHISRDDAECPLEAFREVNTRGTLNLARQAAFLGVRRFVFISSIGVNGNQSLRPFNEEDAPDPVESYAVSKLEAEQGLMRLGQQTGMEIVIIRPPLVYGANAPGNFGKLMSAVKRGLPLPLGAVTGNRRTLIGLDNLLDFILTCINHPAAANQVLLAGDDEDLSTTELLRRMSAALDAPARLLPVPVSIIRVAAALLGKGAMIDRLCGSLQVDISKARDILGWVPPFSVDEGLARAARVSRMDPER